MDHDQKMRQWERKLIPIIVSWGLFFAVNSTINQAPTVRDQLVGKHIAIFFALLFIALYFTFALVLRSKRRGLLASGLICGLLVLRLLRLTSSFLVLLLVTFISFLEWYFSRPKMHRMRDRL